MPDRLAITHSYLDAVSSQLRLVAGATFSVCAGGDHDGTEDAIIGFAKQFRNLDRLLAEQQNSLAMTTQLVDTVFTSVDNRAAGGM